MSRPEREPVPLAPLDQQKPEQPMRFLQPLPDTKGFCMKAFEFLILLAYLRRHSRIPVIIPITGHTEGDVS